MSLFKKFSDLLTGDGDARERLLELFRTIAAQLEQLGAKTEQAARAEPAALSLMPTLQFIAKSAEKDARLREHQLTELRAHLSTELERLGGTLRLDAAKQGALEVFKAVLPALDDIEHVLREGPADGPGKPALRMVHRRLTDSFARLGIEQIPIEEKVTVFDAQLHDGEIFAGDVAEVKDLAPGTIVAVARSGYRVGATIVRASRVSIVGDVGGERA